MPGKKIKSKQAVPRLRKRSRRPANVSRASSSSLDFNASRYLKLLSDPCGADLTHPIYESGNAGYLIRTSTMYAIPGAAVDFVFEFMPGRGIDTTGGLPVLGYYGYSTIPGGTLGTATVVSGPAFLRDVAGEYRAVAACVKVHYIGTELNRAGVVAMGLKPDHQLSNGEVITSSASAFQAKCGHRTRIMSTHELKWAPLANADAEYVSSTQPGLGLSNISVSSGTVAITSMTPATVQYEIVCVWEWTPKFDDGGSLSVSVTGPRSVNTRSNVLRALGDIGKWAVSSSGQSAIGYAAKALMGPVYGSLMG